MLFRLFKWGVKIISILVSCALLISYLSAFISPKELWFLQLFGLAYPALLLGLMIFGGLNLLFNGKWIFTLFVFLIGGFTHAKYFGIDFKTPDSTEFSDKKLKVMSFNVRLFDAYNFVSPPLEDSKAEFIKLFKQESPDILCLQEYAEDHSNKRLIPPEDIKQAGAFTEFVTTMTLEKKKMFLGQAIYSKHPIVNAGTIGDSTLSIPSIYADIVKGEDTIRIINFHLESIRFQKDEYSLFDTEVVSSKSIKERVIGLVSKLKKAYPLRAQQAEQIIEYALKSPYPIILNGDLNDPPTSYVYSMINAYFQDAFYEGKISMANTYAGKVPAGRIDYIFHDDRFAPISFKTWKEKVLSDHFPITATFKIK